MKGHRSMFCNQSRNNESFSFLVAAEGRTFGEFGARFWVVDRSKGAGYFRFLRRPVRELRTAKPSPIFKVSLSTDVKRCIPSATSALALFSPASSRQFVASIVSSLRHQLYLQTSPTTLRPFKRPQE